MSSTCLGDERILLAVDLTLFSVLPLLSYPCTIHAGGRPHSLTTR